MRPPDKERPRVEARSRREGAARTALHLKNVPDVRDTAQVDLWSYQAELATTARDHGLQAAERNDAEWAGRVLKWLCELAPGTEVAADDVRREFGRSSAMGSVFRTASRRGVLVPVGLQESTAITRHRGLQRRWART